MKLVLQFDCCADIIEVPQHVVDNKAQMQKLFLKWLYSKASKHSYWVKWKDRTGNVFEGVRYRGDAFVEWLNKKVLTNESQKARIVEENVCEYADDLPVLFF